MTKKSQIAKQQSRKQKTHNLERSFSFDRSAINEEARTVELAFSSEEPYERWYGTEVLSHKSQSVKLDRLNGGAAVLVNHDVGDQVGVVEEARVDGDRVGRAVVRFSRSNRGQEIFQDVVDGIRGQVSVGYVIHDYDEKEVDGKNVLTAKSWEPHEVSVVAVPADPGVGVGRSIEQDEQPEIEITKIEATKMEDDKKVTEKAAEPEFDHKVELGKLRETETKRCKQIRSMADAHNADELGRQAIDEGWQYPDFQKALLDVVGKRNQKARVESESDGNLGLTGGEVDQFSFVRLMNAVSQPQDRSAQKAAGFELEVSEQGAKQFGADFRARGSYIPQEILERGFSGKRVLNAGTATDGPELIATDLLAGSFIDVLRNSQVTAQAGVRTLPGLVGLVDIPRQTTAATMTWLSAEDADATESDPQFDQVSLSPKDAAVFTETTRRLTMQSTPSIEGIIRSDLAQAIGIGTDTAILYGTGANGQPKGVALQTGINTFDLAAADATYAETVRMIKETMVDNALIGNLGYLIDPNGWEHLITTEKFSGTGRTILENGLMNGYRALVSNQIAAEDYFFGNWSDVLVGEWGG